MKKYFTPRSMKKFNEDAQVEGFERTLGPWQLILIGIGAIIGAGIFTLAGPAAGQHAGPAVILSFLLGAIACSFAGLAYAELSSTIPVSGGAYTFVYATMGELAAWLTFGMILLTYCLGAATVASGWSAYMVSFLHDFGINVPACLTSNTGAAVMLSDGSAVMSLINAPALLIVALLTWVVYKGAQTAAWINTLIVIIKMSVLSLFIIIGAFYIDPQNWSPFIPENTGEYGHFGFSGIITGAAVVLLAFTGFDAVATTAQETKNPQKDLPIGIMVSLLICALFYIMISAVLTGIVPYSKLNVAEPMSIAVNTMNMPWFSVLIKVGAIFGLTSVVLVLLFASVRILFAVAHDGLLPSCFKKVHKIHNTPHILTISIGVFVAILASCISIGDLSKLANLGTSLTFGTVCIANLVMRRTMPDLPRGFKCPAVYFVSISGALLFFGIASSLLYEIYDYAIIWFCVLAVVYFGYSSKGSLLLNELEQAEQKADLQKF